MREAILKALREEGHISGAKLGERLNISRTAVWKHIGELRKRGYEIGSSPRCGYSFVKGTNLLIPEDIVPGLKTHIIGKRILYREEVTSTQDIAKKMARDSAEEGTIVISESQTEGRGRKGRSWVSPRDGGVYLSIILRPKLVPSRVLQISLVAGVAVIKAIKGVAPLQPEMKWPNDIIIGGKKVGGILTEMSCELDGVNYIVLGIGVNVNTPGYLLTKPTDGVATSLAEECGEDISRVGFVQCLLAEFEAIYNEFLTTGFCPIREEWKAMNNTIGSRVKITEAEGEIEGKALDIDAEGFLLVRKENGDVKKILSGDVTLIAQSH
jgi:BirA family biotin operon repressor/biotin-[acetyl-CoA-carboxylase] ligase